MPLAVDVSRPAGRLTHRSRGLADSVGYLPRRSFGHLSHTIQRLAFVIEVQAPTPLRVRAFGRVEPAYYALC